MPILRDWGEEEELVKETEKTREVYGQPREWGTLAVKSRESPRMYGEL